MKGLNKIFGWLLLLPAVLPLIYIDGILYPYVAPKTLLLRAFSLIAGAIFVFLVFSGERCYWERLRSKIAWIPGALLAVAFLTSALGKDFYRSFWSTFERGDGLLTLASVVLFFYLILLYADRKFLTNLFKITALVGTLAASYAFFQWIQSSTGIDLPLIEEPRGRFGGTFGNAAFLAGYLGMTLFSALAYASQSEKWRRTAYGSAVLQGFVIFLTATRGAMLALIIVGIIALIYIAKSGLGRWRGVARWALTAAVFLAVLFFFFKAQIAKIPFEPVSRLASISLEDSGVSNRLFVWKNLLGEGLKSPLTGYGAEHIEFLFNRVYVPGAVAEEWFDRSHNSFLDYFLQYGIAGLLLYAILIFFLGFIGWKLWRAGEGLGIYFAAAAVVYAVNNFFVFDTAMSLWLLFVFFAAALVYSSRSEPSSAFSFPKSRIVGACLPVGRVILGIAILYMIIPVSINPYRANALLAKGYVSHISDAKSAVALMEQGLALGTYANLEYGYQVYVMYTERQVNMLEGEERLTAYRYTEKTLSDNLKRFSYDARTAIYLAHVIDLAPPEAVRDEALLKNALLRAIELSPKRIQPYYLLANMSIRKGDLAVSKEEKARFYEEAVAVLSIYAGDAPKDAEPRFIIANLYVLAGNSAKAAEWAEKGRVLYEENGGGLNSARRAAMYYIGTEEWPKALRFMEDVVNKEPEDLASTYNLAKLYFMTGNRERALQIVKQLMVQKPGLVETDPVFLKAIKLN
ncbi:MAG: O-antigen ligase family protein [Candidatus Liptonbacteria bacterium]|nr:O-antigen ligase family protein [Candidatus Liptonbacteria bacterium]